MRKKPFGMLGMMLELLAFWVILTGAMLLSLPIMLCLMLQFLAGVITLYLKRYWTH